MDIVATLKGNYFSLPSAPSFYVNLHNLIGEEDYANVLKRLRDITTIGNSNEILKAKSNPANQKDIYKDVIFKNGIFEEIFEEGKKRKIVELSSVLKDIDNTLNLGNYLLKENTDKLLEASSKHKDKFVESFYSEDIISREIYTFLENLIDRYIEKKNSNGQKNKKDINYKFIQGLIGQPQQNISENYKDLILKLKSSRDKNLQTIYGAVKQIKKTLEYKHVKNDEFVHYTSLSTLNFLIKPKEKGGKKEPPSELRLSHAQQLNDPTEGIKFLDLIDTEENNLKKFLDERDYIFTAYYLTSMSKVKHGIEVEDSLPMWKTYGGEAKGINLTYHHTFIEAIVDSKNAEVYEVCYLDNLNDIETDKVQDLEKIKKIVSLLRTIKNSFDKIRENPDLLSIGIQMISSIRYLFKSTSYSYENEYRVLFKASKNTKISLEPSGTTAIPRLYTYLELENGKKLQYSKVKLGPNCQDIDFVAPYIKYCDPTIEVTKSKIPYREPSRESK